MQTEIIKVLSVALDNGEQYKTLREELLKVQSTYKDSDYDLMEDLYPCDPENYEEIQNEMLNRILTECREKDCSYFRIENW